MRIDKFTYGKVETCLYEAIRAIIKGKKVDAEREGRALIDPEMTPYNVSYIHPCLQPLASHKPGKGYTRGTAVAEYHNSQVSNAYHHAAITGDERQMSKAIGVILTMPKDYMQGLIPDLTDEEYEYLTNKLEAEACKRKYSKNDQLEASIKKKTSRIRLTEEQMEKAKEFLLNGKDSVLEVLGIRKEDVLFWAIHLDESFPHLHLMALPTQEKTYEEDVYSKRVKKDGTRTLLHKKGDVEISYSATQYYERVPKGQNFYDRFHHEVIKKMAEKGIDASGLLNGATEGKGFIPTDLVHDQRKESVQIAVTNLALKKKIEEERKKHEAEIEEERAAKAAAEADTAKAVRERDLYKAEAESAKADMAEMKRERDALYDKYAAEIKQYMDEAIKAKTAAAKAEETAAKAKTTINDMQAIIEEKDIEISEKVAAIGALKTTIDKLKTSLNVQIERATNFISDLIAKAIEMFTRAKDKNEEQIIGAKFVTEVNKEVKSLYKPLEALQTQAEALVKEDEDVVSGIQMATFIRTDQKLGFAKKQIEKAATNNDDELDEEYMNIALLDWFNRDRYEPIIARMSEEQAKAFMKPSERAERAYEAAVAEMEEEIER